MAELSMDLALPVKPLTDNADVYPELAGIHNSIRLLASAFDNTVNEVIMPAFEAITIGQLVAVFNDAGTGKLRKALDPTYYCIGFAANSVSAGQSCLCRIRWRYPNFAVGSLTPGARYYLSAGVAGAITTVLGNQLIGIAQSGTVLLWKPQL